MIIGITGTFCSGKGTIAEYLQTQGWGYVSLSDMLRQEARKQGRSLDRVELAKIGEELKRKIGPFALAQKALEYMKEHPSPHFVVESLRNLEEIRRFRKEKGFVLFSVDAPMEIRYKRELERKRENAGTPEEFKKREEAENSDNPYFLQLRACMKEADVQFDNKEIAFTNR